MIKAVLMPLLLLALVRPTVEYTGTQDRELEEFVPEFTHIALRYPARDDVVACHKVSVKVRPTNWLGLIFRQQSLVLSGSVQTIAYLGIDLYLPG